MQSFDVAAQTYDESFVHSAIGKMQRDRVYYFLKENINTGMSVLELNAGTGEDAIWLTSKGCNVLATDVSEKMLAIITNKAKCADSNLKTQIVDLQAFSTSDFSKKYDLIFSNFGGLNCINTKQLENVIVQANKLLKPNGKLIMVIMPKFCLVESIYFLLKFSFKNISRRLTSNYVLANVNGISVKTWYYSPTNIRLLSKPFFNVNKLASIGFFLPPSYTETYFFKKKKLLNLLNLLEKKIANISAFAGMSDHFYIELEKK